MRRCRRRRVPARAWRSRRMRCSRAARTGRSVRCGAPTHRTNKRADWRSLCCALHCVSAHQRTPSTRLGRMVRRTPPKPSPSVRRRPSVNRLIRSALQRARRHDQVGDCASAPRRCDGNRAHPQRYAAHSSTAARLDAHQAATRSASRLGSRGMAWRGAPAACVRACARARVCVCVQTCVCLQRHSLRRAGPTDRSGCGRRAHARWCSRSGCTTSPYATAAQHNMGGRNISQHTRSLHRRGISWRSLTSTP